MKASIGKYASQRFEPRIRSIETIHRFWKSGRFWTVRTSYLALLNNSASSVVAMPTSPAFVIADATQIESTPVWTTGVMFAEFIPPIATVVEELTDRTVRHVSIPDGRVSHLELLGKLCRPPDNPRLYDPIPCLVEEVMEVPMICFSSRISR